MGTISITLIFILFSLFSPTIAAANIESDADGLLQTYIIYVKKPKYDEEIIDLDSWYQSFLPETIPNRQSRMVRCYKNVISGFAARLTAEEVKKAMETKRSRLIISAHVEKKLQPHTTHSHAFLGLNRDSGFWKDSNFGKGIIIGVLDTGITPGHPSFSDEGMPPPPAKWKGKCELQSGTCNNKLIGYRNFYSRKDEPIDITGHGTHTASTAAGNFVNGANVFGLANGTAAGMAPLAHLAIYKLHDDDFNIKQLPSTTVSNAIETAVEDGVDVISLSIGVGITTSYFDNSIAVAAFSAIKKGVFVSIAAANFGPNQSTLVNDAPWMLTVGASSIDRSLAASAQLGNQASYDGETLFQPKDFPSDQQLPLVYVGARNHSEPFCTPETLKSNINDVKGKVVLCQKTKGVNAGKHVKDAGGAAMILMNEERLGHTLTPDYHPLPAVRVSYADGESVKAYINSTSSPTAALVFKGTVIGRKYAPEVAFFSSRGPSTRSPGILKPDIIGPGLNILAAWSKSVENNANTKSNFNLESGTSMSCPHLSGIAALIKSVHPDWSPAAIKSAMMTTADILNLQGKPIVDQSLLPADLYAVGAGHINPSKANDPGLIYDIQPDDYIPYLCSLKYTDVQVESIVRRVVRCLNVPNVTEAELNYPSFSIKLESSPQTHHRTVTNVGPSSSSYTPQIIAPEGVKITVQPDKLSFTEKNQKATYSVTFARTCETLCTPYAQAYLSWVSGRHTVRSPIVITFE